MIALRYHFASFRDKEIDIIDTLCFDNRYEFFLSICASTRDVTINIQKQQVISDFASKRIRIRNIHDNKETIDKYDSDFGWQVVNYFGFIGSKVAEGLSAFSIVLIICYVTLHCNYYPSHFTKGFHCDVSYNGSTTRHLHGVNCGKVVILYFDILLEKNVFAFSVIERHWECHVIMEDRHVHFAW